MLKGREPDSQETKLVMQKSRGGLTQAETVAVAVQPVVTSSWKMWHLPISYWLLQQLASALATDYWQLC